MHRTLLALTLILGAASAMAGGFSFDLPNLTWPTDGGVTVSTAGCEQPVQTPKADAPRCQ
jgi:hypothetical protein